MQETITTVERDRQALERYREADGRLNLDHLVADFHQGMREIEREAVQTYRELYQRQESSSSPRVPSSPAGPQHTPTPS